MEDSGLVLGLDIGVASIGWALADLTAGEIRGAGVRVFDAAMDNAKFEVGDQGASHAVARRQARLQRRQLRRRAARQRDLYIALQSAGLLPFAGMRAERRHEELEKLDQILREKWRPLIREEAPEIAEPDLVLCYHLRAHALQQPLEPFEVGRALYHLGQRRGFQSNRREARAVAVSESSTEEEKSEIKASINTLDSVLKSENLTLGQRLARINPRLQAIRNRRRTDVVPIWTGRKMYEEEFDRIWTGQARHHEQLTETLRHRITRLMFWQRTISSGKPGKCELQRNPAVDRAPRSSLLAQHFRLVQAANNLRIWERGTVERRLTHQERPLLVQVLETAITESKGRKRNSELFGLRFSKVKEILGIPKQAKLNLEDEGADSYLRGNRTNAIMVRAFGAERWRAMEDAQRKRIVRKWIKEQSPAKLLSMAKGAWGLDDAAAERLVGTEPEDGYAALSHVAMSRLLPAMENGGLTYAEAVARAYGNLFSSGEAQKYLPPVDASPLGRIPNPVVMRALSELRKVVNAVVREYRRPCQIRIELARSLKNTAEQRHRFFDSNNRLRRQRAAAREIIKDLGLKPSRDAIDRVLLYQECEPNCGGQCVYCGERLLTSKGAYGELFSAQSGIEVEHVLPKRCQDDSFSNKVLAHRKCNLEKGDQTPFQAFSNDPRWTEMLDRAERLGNKGRLDRFRIQAESELQEFTNRHLSDTRYVSKLAVQYVEQLYGGRDAAVPWHDRNRRCVYVSTGVLTARLRRGWGLEAILREPTAASNGQGGKGRTDHRHHAIDAIVLALTSERLVQQASIESANHDRSNGHLLPRFFSPPWPTHGDTEDRVKKFASDVKQVIDSVNVSHRPCRKLNGPLHKATYFSPKRDELGYTSLRVPVSDLTEKDIGVENDAGNAGTISDPTIRKVLQRHLAALGGEIKKLKTELPHLETRSGRIPIRYVRIRVPGTKMVPVRAGLVATKENHHVVVFEMLDSKKGRIWYAPTPVTLKEAMHRKQARKKDASVEIIRTRDANNSPVFYLMKGDMVEMLDAPSGLKRVTSGMNGRRDLYVVDSLSEGDYSFSRQTKSLSAAKADGITTAQLKERGDRIRIRTIDELRLRGCRKVEVDPIGRVIFLSPPVDRARGVVEE